MENKYYDILTYELLTPENAMRCLDGNLQNIPDSGDIGRNIVGCLLLYLDYALSIKDYDLLHSMLWRIISDLDGIS